MPYIDDESNDDPENQEMEFSEEQLERARPYMENLQKLGVLIPIGSDD